MKERRHGEQTGLADTVLEVVELGKAGVGLRVGGQLEAGLSGEQYSLGADRQLEPQPQQTEHIGDRGRRKTFPQLLQIGADAVLRDLP